MDDPRLEAERLVAHALGVDRAELARTGPEPVGPGEARRLARAVRRRMSGEPLQHIEGSVHFRDLILAADRRALIPRPETEQLVDRIAAWAAGGHGETTRGRREPRKGSRVVKAGRGRRPSRSLTPLGVALDIGTGSGAIALSLVQEGIARRVVALDSSPEALQQARENREATGLGRDVVELRRVTGRLWGAVAADERFDLIVSNPPYIRKAALDELPVQIRSWEPREALAGGEDGLEVIREIISGAGGRLRPGGALYLEIGEEQGVVVRNLLEGSGAWSEVAVERDLSGRERFVRAEPVVKGGAR